MLIPALLVLQVVLPPRPDPSDPYRLPPVRGPELAAIEVRADSVLFFAMPATTESSISVYGFSRADGQWSRRGVVPQAMVADHFGLLPGRRNSVIERWAFIDAEMELVATRGGQRRTRTEPLPNGDVRVTTEQVRDSVTLGHALVRSPGDILQIVARAPAERNARPISSRIAAVLLEPDTLWLGLIGFSSDLYGGQRGGLVALDLRTGRTEAFWLPELSNETVNAVARVNGAIWVGTTGGIGIREQGGTWRWLRRGDLGLPSANVEALASAGDTVWISTGAGPGGFSAGRWFGAQWQPLMEGDSIVMVPTDRRPEWTQRNAILRLAWYLRLGDMGRAFVEAFESLPSEWLTDWRDGDRDHGDLLAEPMLFPFAVQSFSRAPVQSGEVYELVRRRVSDSDEAARALLTQLDDVDPPRAGLSGRDILYRRVLRPDMVLEDARRLMAQTSIPRHDASLAGAALSEFGDQRDLPCFFDEWPGNVASVPPNFRWDWVAPIVGRSQPDSLVRVLGNRPVEQRLALIHYMLEERVTPRPRPLAGVCLLAQAGFADPNLDTDARARFGELLPALGVFDSLPLLIQRDTWDPVHFIDRMRRSSDEFRELPPGMRGAEARAWIRQWWASGAAEESNDCRRLT